MQTVMLPKDLVGGWTPPAARAASTIEDKCESTIDQLDDGLKKFRDGEKTRWFVSGGDDTVHIHVYYSTKRLNLGSDKKGNPINHIVAQVATVEATVEKMKQHIRNGWLNGPIAEESQRRSDAKRKSTSSEKAVQL